MRQNIFDLRGELIGQNYQRDNGDWMHKWANSNGFDRFSWRGKAEGEDMNNWTYKDVK